MFSVKTNIQQYDTFGQFAEAYKLGADDLVITQSFIYEPYMKPLGLKCHFVMQEKYGAGEPSDEMIQHIMDDLRSVSYKRVVAVGGGTVIDISKLFALGTLMNVTDAFEHKIPIVKAKQLVIVPTTCGTGSEVTNISIAELKDLNKEEHDIAVRIETLKAQQENNRRSILKAGTAVELFRGMEGLESFDETIIDRLVENVEAIGKNRIAVTFCGGFRVEHPVISK
jgi:hypothetical protein